MIGKKTQTGEYSKSMPVQDCAYLWLLSTYQVASLNCYMLSVKYIPDFKHIVPKKKQKKKTGKIAH